MDITKETLLQFAASNQTDDHLMKLKKDGVVYIYEPQYRGNGLRQTGKADLIGLVVNSTFYSTGYFYGNIDKDFRVEVTAFEERYRQAYADYISQYTADNLAPITENTVSGFDDIEAALDDYKRNYLYDQAIREMFQAAEDGCISYCHEYKYDSDMETFAPLFIKYLVKGEDFLHEYIKMQAEINAKTINLHILEDVERRKVLKELANDETLMKRVALCKKLKEEAGETVRMTLNIDGTIFDKLRIDTPQLVNVMKYQNGVITDYFFTAKERAAIRDAWKTCRPYEGRITIDNIVNITYGKKEIWRNS